MLKRQASNTQTSPTTVKPQVAPATTSSRRPPAALQMTSSTTGTALTHSGETVSGESLMTAPDDYSGMVAEPGSFVDVTANGLVMPKAAFAREGYHSPSSSTSSLRSFGPGGAGTYSRRSSGYSQFGAPRQQPDLSNPYRDTYERPLDTVKRLSRQADQSSIVGQPQWIPSDAASIWPDAFPLVQPYPPAAKPVKSRSSVSLQSLSGRTRHSAKSTPASPVVPPMSMSRKSSMASTTSPPTAYSIQRDFLSSLAPREGGYAIAAMTRSPSTYDHASTYSQQDRRVSGATTTGMPAMPPLPPPSGNGYMTANSSRPSLQESSTSLSTASQATLPPNQTPTTAPALSKTPSPLSQAVTAGESDQDHLEMRTKRPAQQTLMEAAPIAASSPLARPPIGRQGSTATTRQVSSAQLTTNSVKSKKEQRKEQEAIAKQRKEQEKQRAAAEKARKKQEKIAAEREKLERERQRVKEKAEKQRAATDAKRKQQPTAAASNPKRMNSLRSAVFSMPATPLKGKTKQLSVPPLTPGASAPSTPAQRALKDAELSDDPAASPRVMAPTAATSSGTATPPLPLPPPPVAPEVLALPPPRSVSKPPGTAFPPPKLATEGETAPVSTANATPPATHPGAKPSTSAVTPKQPSPKRRKSIWGLFKRLGGSQKGESSSKGNGSNAASFASNPSTVGRRDVPAAPPMPVAASLAHSTAAPPPQQHDAEPPVNANGLLLHEAAAEQEEDREIDEDELGEHEDATGPTAEPQVATMTVDERLARERDGNEAETGLLASRTPPPQAPYTAAEVPIASVTTPDRTIKALPAIPLVAEDKTPTPASTLLTNEPLALAEPLPTATEPLPLSSIASPRMTSSELPPIAGSMPETSPASANSKAGDDVVAAHEATHATAPPA